MKETKTHSRKLTSKFTESSQCQQLEKTKAKMCLVIFNFYNEKHSAAQTKGQEKRKKETVRKRELGSQIRKHH